MRRLLLVLLLTWLSPKLADAHAIGLSRGQYRALSDGLEAELVFTRSELGAAPDLAQRIVQGLHVSDAAGERCPGELIRQDSPDAASERLLARYRCAEPSTLRVTLAFWEELSPGHRHLVSRGAPAGPAALEAPGVLHQREQPSFELAGFEPPEPPTPALAGWVGLGVEHILSGHDHLAFLLALVLVARTLRELGATVTLFTLAHSLTLALATLGVLTPPSWAVECAIALSICYVGIENLRGAARTRRALVFAFGLIHGFGFAGALRELGTSAARAPLALFGFNLGVELGQLALLLCTFPLLLRLRQFPWFSRRAVPGLSAAIALAGALWFIGRLPLAPPSTASRSRDVQASRSWHRSSISRR